MSTLSSWMLRNENVGFYPPKIPYSFRTTVPFRVGAECVITIAPPSTRVLCAASRLVYSPIRRVDYIV